MTKYEKATLPRNIWYLNVSELPSIVQRLEELADRNQSLPTPILSSRPSTLVLGSRPQTPVLGSRPQAPVLGSRPPMPGLSSQPPMPSLSPRTPTPILSPRQNFQRPNTNREARDDTDVEEHGTFRVSTSDN